MKLVSEKVRKGFRRPSFIPFLTAALLIVITAVILTTSLVLHARHQRAGSISLNGTEQHFTFQYSTPTANARNWIAVYHTYWGGPDQEKYVDPAVTWAYAPEQVGQVTVDTSSLQPGYYKVYFLSKDGYKWLADPITVLLPGSGPIEFIHDKLTTQNARQGDFFFAKLGGLVANPQQQKANWTKVEAKGAEWINVAHDGTISGTPSHSTKNTDVVFQVSGAHNSTASIHVHIPVVGSGQPLVERLKVMSFNMWFGGSKVNNYHPKQIKFLMDSNVDVVGTQESWNGQAVRLAKALGWHYWQSHEVGIISRYPIVETYPEQQAGGSVRIALDGDRSQVVMWNVHLGFDPYGPYDFCYDHMSLDQVMVREARSRRTPQIIEIVHAMKDKLSQAEQVPVLLTGDFNAPSHLDWTNATSKAHCGAGFVPWPSSVYPIEAGLVDSYREKHPDPTTEPGNTWSPIYLNNDGRPEPLDRIDFVYHKGSGLTVLSSEAIMVGHPAAEPHHQNNEWTSDHKAVLTTYKVSNRDEPGDL